MDPNCPNPVECAANPCDVATCPRFLNALCQPDHCNGECRAAFFKSMEDLGRGPEIKTCKTETCAEKECPTRRICMDEIFPPNCPEDKPQCRQFMRAVCELPPKPLPPSDCTAVLCGPGTVCEISERRNGPRATCVAFKPRSCEELGECDEGMQCRVRLRGDKRSVVRCVPLSAPSRPSDCGELECDDRFVCMLFGREGKRKRARCVKKKPKPITCKELDCEMVGMICGEEGGKPHCRVPRNCDELKCPNPFTCNIIDIPAIPEEFRCPFGKPRCKGVLLQPLPNSRTIGCFDPTLSTESCNEVECSNDKVCSSKDFPQSESYLSMCVSKDDVSKVSHVATCDISPENFCPANEACIDFVGTSYHGFAHCSQINCDKEPCRDEEDQCVVSTPEFVSLSGISHYCVPINHVLLEVNGTCAGGRETPCPESLTCTNVRTNTIPLGTACITPRNIPVRNCDDLTCEAGQECILDDVAGQVVRASCISSSFASQLLAAFKKS